jgi:hypothetical protein
MRAQAGHYPGGGQEEKAGSSMHLRHLAECSDDVLEVEIHTKVRGCVRSPASICCFRCRSDLFSMAGGALFETWAKRGQQEAHAGAAERPRTY